ncbi:MAG: cupin domain-containing protein [Bryobacteraceae bacterium]
MICRTLSEGERFWCAGNLYTMLIPRDDTQCFEAAMETIEPGHRTPSNAHATFVQMYFMVSGAARVHIGGESRDIEAPGVAFVPRSTDHHVENIGDRPLQYIYVSIWPGQIPPQDGVTWREACDTMIQGYAAQGYAPQGNA